MWLLVLDSNWLVDRVQPVSNPGLRVTHSWGTSFLLGGWGTPSAEYQTKPNPTSSWQKGTGNTDTIFLSNALPVTVTGSIWQEVSVCDTGNGVNSGFLFFKCESRARSWTDRPTWTVKLKCWVCLFNLKVSTQSWVKIVSWQFVSYGWRKHSSFSPFFTAKSFLIFPN